MSFNQWTVGRKPKKAVLALLAIVFSLSLAAATVAAQESPATRETSRGCLWQVSSEKGTVFLLGTVHLLKPGTHTVSPAAEAAFQQAGTILLELDLDEGESPESRQLFARKALLQGETLEDKVSPETLALAKEKTEALGLPFDRLRSLKPWSLSLTLTLFKLQTLGFDPKHGVDRYYFDRAKQAGKEIRSPGNDGVPVGPVRWNVRQVAGGSPPADPAGTGSDGGRNRKTGASLVRGRERGTGRVDAGELQGLSPTCIEG